MPESVNKMLPPAELYGPDGWTVLDPHPFAADNFDDGDWDEGIKQIGYEAWTQIGGQDDTPQVPLVMTVFRQADTASDLPHFLVELHGNASGRYLYVFVADLPSLMRLLGEWGPAVQGATLAHLASFLPHDEKGMFAALGQIGAKPEKVGDKLDSLKRSVDQLGEGLERAIGGIG
jgi:hypothetical protein